MSAEQASAAVDLLGLDSEVVRSLQEIPMRGSLEGDVPVDSTIYRIHEVTQVDGVTINALINEKSSAGIMSATTFNLDIKRVESDEGPELGSPMTASSSHTPGAEVSEAACTQLSPRDGRLSHRFMPHRIVLW